MSLTHAHATVCWSDTSERIPLSLEQIFSEVFAIPQSSVLDTLALHDIPSWDSLAHMMLIVRLEEDYKVQFTGDQIADFKTVGDTRSALIALGVTL